MKMRIYEPIVPQNMLFRCIGAGFFNIQVNELGPIGDVVSTWYIPHCRFQAVQSIPLDWSNNNINSQPVTITGINSPALVWLLHDHTVNVVSALDISTSPPIVITTDQLRGVLWIPAQALFESDGRTFVYLQTPAGFMPHDVTLVRRSESQAVLTGVSEGGIVAMSSPDQQSKSAAPQSAMKALQQ